MEPPPFHFPFLPVFLLLLRGHREDRASQTHFRKNPNPNPCSNPNPFP